MNVVKPRIKIAFRDWFPGFDPTDNFFTQLLNPHYDLVVSKRPDFTIYSVNGKEHLGDSGVRIFWSGENSFWDFEDCHFAFTSDFVDDPRHYRYPMYAVDLPDPSLLVKSEVDVDAILAQKTGFCNFVYSNSEPDVRDSFFAKLSKYKRVDSGGRHLNNIGGPVDDKRAFIRRYKFTIAFENSTWPGYTTEKLSDPMLVDSLPIYWGNELVHKDFNTRSFVNAHEYADLDEVVERVIQLDRDDDLYASYLQEPWYPDNEVTVYVDRDLLLERFHVILSETPVHVRLPLRKRIDHWAWWVRRPLLQKVHGFVTSRPLLYTVVRAIWRASGLQRLFRTRFFREFARRTPG